jgi:tryptophan synthase alpha chain
MNRLQSLFNRKQQDILSVYFTAGYPQLDDTKEIITTLAQNGVDMIEIGVPFSDPMADGVVIQESSNIALKNGMTLRKLLEQVGETRELAPTTPLILMGYLNPMMQYGINELFSKCSEIGIDAMIIPDLPFEDYLRDFKPLCDKYDIPIIMLITPETSDERIKLIDNHCDGFIYMVSSASTTGTRDRFDEVQESYFRRIAALQLKHQRLIGFGISNPATFATATSYSAGAIIGSLFIKCLRKTPENISEAVNQLLTTIGRK